MGEKRRGKKMLGMSLAFPSFKDTFQGIEFSVLLVGRSLTLLLVWDGVWVWVRQLVEYEGLTLSALQPGHLLNCKVKAVMNDGLMLSFLTFFTGTVRLTHFLL